jgi:hypothetical protein
MGFLRAKDIEANAIGYERQIPRIDLDHRRADDIRANRLSRSKRANRPMVRVK